MTWYYVERDQGLWCICLKVCLCKFTQDFFSLSRHPNQWWHLACSTKEPLALLAHAQLCGHALEVILRAISADLYRAWNNGPYRSSAEWRKQTAYTGCTRRNTSNLWARSHIRYVCYLYSTYSTQVLSVVPVSSWHPMLKSALRGEISLIHFPPLGNLPLGTTPPPLAPAAFSTKEVLHFSQKYLRIARTLCRVGLCFQRISVALKQCLTISQLKSRSGETS